MKLREEVKNMKKLLFIFLIMLITSVSGFSITTDEITETSIIWNLSALPEGVNITEIAFDGITVSGHITNPQQMVQNNLYAKETHLIVVKTDDGNISTAQATTGESDQKNLTTTINLWFMVVLAFIFIVGAVLINVPFLAFVGTAFSIIGMIASLNNNFLTGIVFVITMAASLFVGFKLE